MVPLAGRQGGERRPRQGVVLPSPTRQGGVQQFEGGGSGGQALRCVCHRTGISPAKPEKQNRSTTKDTKNTKSAVFPLVSFVS